ncbi:MAG TPA: hemerythrin domain-containing protein [Burkholderiales bacterium]|nr:hemerythrin domain-containing protein [Burkholderiales bacterium]
MATMEWSDSLELGVDQMDDTHKEFVEHLNALSAAADEDMLAQFDAFYAHTVEHFGQEHEWMQAIEFPPIHCHDTEHEGVLEVMREVRRHLEAGDYNVGRVLAREMGEWFRIHAGTMDAMLAAVLKSGGAQAVGCAHGRGCAGELSNGARLSQDEAGAQH